MADYAGPFRRLIHGLKFEGMDYLGCHLGDEIVRRLAPLLLDAPFLRPDLIVPVPLHWWRRYRRGYNQACLLARPIARQTGRPLADGLLSRIRAGRRQLGLTRQERLRSLEGCYLTRRDVHRAGGRLGVGGRSVLLVDDVVTTGATLEACARALLRAGAFSVAACVLARTPRSGTRG